MDSVTPPAVFAITGLRTSVHPVDLSNHGVGFSHFVSGGGCPESFPFALHAAIKSLNAGHDEPFPPEDLRVLQMAF